MNPLLEQKRHIHAAYKYNRAYGAHEGPPRFHQPNWRRPEHHQGDERDSPMLDCFESKTKNSPTGWGIVEPGKQMVETYP